MLKRPWGHISSLPQPLTFSQVFFIWFTTISSLRNANTLPLHYPERSDPSLSPGIGQTIQDYLGWCPSVRLPPRLSVQPVMFSLETPPLTLLPLIPALPCCNGSVWKELSLYLYITIQRLLFSLVILGIHLNSHLPKLYQICQEYVRLLFARFVFALYVIYLFSFVC